MGLALQQDLLPEEQKVKWSMHLGIPEEELEAPPEEELLAGGLQRTKDSLD